MKPLVCHELIANVSTGSYVTNPPLEIPQGDCNSHQIIIKLINNEGHPVSLSGCNSAKITWINQEGVKIQSSAVKIINPYRGVLTYIVGPALVQDKGRYTAYLDINSECECSNEFSVTFVITIVERNDRPCCPDNMETTISQWFVNKVDAHMENTLIHLSLEEKQVLNQFIEDHGLELISKIKNSFTTVDRFTDLMKLPEYMITEGKIVKVDTPNKEDIKDFDNIIIFGDDEDYESPMYFEYSTDRWIQNEFLGMTTAKLVKQVQSQVDSSAVVWEIN